jgi:hypothetical protein
MSAHKQKLLAGILWLGLTTGAIAGSYQFYNPTVGHVTIHDGGTGPGLYAYNHMASVEWFDGRFHVVWGANSSTYFEGKPGQFNVWSTSEDFHHWSEPKQFAHIGSAPLPVDPGIVEWQPELLNYHDRELWCVWFCRSKDPALHGTYLSVLKKGAGENWHHQKIATRFKVGDHGEYSAFTTQNPVLLSSGRVIAPVTLYPAERDAHPGMESRVRRWNAVLYTDDDGKTWRLSDLLSMVDDAAGQWEPFFYEQADGRIRAYMRNFTKGIPPANMWRLTTVGTGAKIGEPVRFPEDPVYSFMETINERPQVLRLPGGRYCLIQQDAWTNHRDYRTRINVALGFSRTGADDFVASIPVSRPGVISRYAQGVEHDGKLYIAYTLGPGLNGPGPELKGIEGAIVSATPRAGVHYVWPRRKELVAMITSKDQAGKNIIQRANPNARTLMPRLLTVEGRQVMSFQKRASAGVDIDPVDFAGGGALELRFDTKVARVQETGMLVLCSLGDRIPIRLGVPSNRPGKLYAYGRDQWQPVADFAPDRWHSVRLTVKAGGFTVAVDGAAARAFPNPLVNPTPRVYLGDGFEVDYIPGNQGSEFIIALDSLTTRSTH